MKPPRFRVDTSEVKRAAVDGRLLSGRMRGDMEQAVARARMLGERVAKKHVPVHTGELLNSIQGSGPHIETRPSGVVAISAEVMARAPHAQVMESGRRPGKWPPMRPIERWVRLKVRRGHFELGKAQRRRRGNRRKATKASTKEGQIRSLAFLVARKIARDGITPRGYMARAHYRAESSLRREVKKISGDWPRSFER